MIKMKDKEQIGSYIKQRIKELGITQSQLAERIAELMGDNSLKDVIKDNVSKWINGKRYPGTEYLYYLAQAIKVPIEDILVAGETRERYDERPLSLYAVAKSGSIEMLGSVMNTYTPDGICVGQNYDEYNKTILDYIVEFERLDMIEYMLKNEYIKVYDTQLQTGIMIGNIYSGQELFKSIVDIAIKKDNLTVFSAFIKRTLPILKENSEDGRFVKKTTWQLGYIFTDNMIYGILKTSKVLEYLAKPFVPAEPEWNEWNAGIVYLKKGTKEELKELKKVQTLSASFNLLLNTAKKINSDRLEYLQQIGEEHNRKVIQMLNHFYERNEYKVSDEGVVTVGLERGCITILADQTVY